MNIPLKVLIMWILFLPVPIINGLLREKWYKQMVGDVAAHQIGTIIVSVMFLVYVYLFFRNLLPALGNKQLFIMGLGWLLLTILFEFGLGLAGGRSWSYMLADYNIFEGRIWPLVLLTVFCSPYIVKSIMQKF